jgi:hypothetical protein
VLSFLAAADPSTSAWAYLSSLGLAGIIVGFVLWKMSRDEWGSHSERDRLRKILDSVLLDLLPLLKDLKERGDENIRALASLEGIVRDLARIREEMERERASWWERRRD